MAPNFPSLPRTSLLDLQPDHHSLLSLRLRDKREARGLWGHIIIIIIIIIIRLLPRLYDCLLLLLLLLLPPLEYHIPNDDYLSHRHHHQHCRRHRHRHITPTCLQITTTRPPHAVHSQHTHTHCARLSRRTGRPDTWNLRAVRRRR